MIKSGVIKDEWLYEKINHSSRETLIFEREDFRVGKIISKSDEDSLRGLKDTSLFMSYFNSINHNYEVINDLIKQIENIRFINCVGNDFKKRCN